MLYDRESETTHGATDASQHAEPEVGKRSLVDQTFGAGQQAMTTGGLPALTPHSGGSLVQRLAGAMAQADTGHVQSAAQHGIASGAQALPHQGTIQKLFGRHDVSGVKAHVGGAAADASQAMGATAYATGDHVAFAGSPDLHTAAHEAAHVVQQRGGVQLKGGVGAAGDRYEQHADQVADLVVQGHSAEHVLDAHAGSASPGGGAVQHKLDLGSVGREESVRSRLAKYNANLLTAAQISTRPIDGTTGRLIAELDKLKGEKDFPAAFVPEIDRERAALGQVTTRAQLQALARGTPAPAPAPAPGQAAATTAAPPQPAATIAVPPQPTGTAAVVPQQPTHAPADQSSTTAQVTDGATHGPADQTSTPAPSHDASSSTAAVTPAQVTPEATWAAWAQTQTGEAHAITPAGSLLRINQCIDVHPALLDEMSHAQIDDLKLLFVATKKTSAGAATDADTKHITKLSSSAGGRLRFLRQIGSSHDHAEDSTVSLFIQDTLKPLYGGTLPDFLLPDRLTPMDRRRLFDVPNAKRKTAPQKRGLEWAITQGPRTVSELVNFSEYFLANLETLDRRADKKSKADYEQQKAHITVSDDEAQTEAKAIAASDAVKREMATAGPVMKAISKGSLDEAQKQQWQQLTGEDFGAPDLAKSPVKKALQQKLKDKVTEQALNAVGVPSDDAIARGHEAVQNKKQDELRKRLAADVRQQMDDSIGTDVADQFAADRAVVDTHGYAAGGTSVDGFWSKGRPEQIAAIQAAAGSGAVPFFSSDSAAYHSLKHYSDIRGTTDRAPQGGSELEAYLKSSTRTIANPDQEVTTQPSQFSANPAFMFFRTIPAAAEGGKPNKMRAIVVVTDQGAPKVATYFQA
jgi:hypothetical protein